MRKILLLFVIIAYLTGFPHSSLCFEVPLKFEKAPLDPNVFFPYGHIGIYMSPGDPGDDYKLPKFNSDKPFFGHVKLEQSEFYIALDVNNAVDNKYTRMFFDFNNNKDLTDDLIIEGKENKQGNLSLGGMYFVEFLPFDLQIKDENGNLSQYSIKPSVYGQSKSIFNSSNTANVSFRVSGAYSGTFKLGKSKYNIKFSDNDGNGKFDDKAQFENTPGYFGNSAVFPRGDIVYISDGRKLDYYDGQYLGDLLLIGDKIFDFKVDIAGKKMILTEIKKGLSKLKLSCKPEFLSLYTADGTHFIMAYKPSGNEIKVPGGIYKLMGYELLRKDEQGDLWSVNAVSTKNTHIVSVKPDTVVTLKFGEPFTPKVFLPILNYRTSANNQNTPMAFNIEGIGKEVIINMSRREGTATKIPLSKKQGCGNRPQEPSYMIIKPDGELVSQGTFEYG